jgi:hypothetical protein
MAPNKEDYYREVSQSIKKNGEHPLERSEVRRAPATPCTVYFFEKTETRPRAGETPRIVYNGETNNLNRWLSDHLRGGAWMVNRMAHALALRRHFEESWYGLHSGSKQERSPNLSCQGCKQISVLSSREGDLLQVVRKYLEDFVKFTWSEGITAEAEYSEDLREEASEEWLGRWAVDRVPDLNWAESHGLPSRSNGKENWWPADEDLRNSGIWRVRQ